MLFRSGSDEMTKAMISSMGKANNPTSAFKDFNLASSAVHDRGRIQEHIQNQNKIVMGNGDTIDLNWLISSG